MKEQEKLAKPEKKLITLFNQYEITGDYQDFKRECQLLFIQKEADNLKTIENLEAKVREMRDLELKVMNGTLSGLLKTENNQLKEEIDRLKNGWQVDKASLKGIMAISEHDCEQLTKYKEVVEKIRGLRQTNLIVCQSFKAAEELDKLLDFNHPKQVR